MLRVDDGRAFIRTASRGAVKPDEFPATDCVLLHRGKQRWRGRAWIKGIVSTAKT
jgi:hypothetical protein